MEKPHSCPYLGMATGSAPSALRGRGRRRRPLLKALESLLDDAASLANLGLGDVEGGGKADDIIVSGLGEQAVLGHLQAHIPCSHSAALHLSGLDDDGVEEPTSTHSGQEG